MVYHYYHNLHTTFHNEHGLGLLFHYSREQDYCRCFFEDGTVFKVKKEIEKRDEIEYLAGLTENRWRRITKKDIQLRDRLLKEGTCRFSLDKDGAFSADLEMADLHYRIRVGVDRYYRVAVCSCGEQNCIHGIVAAHFLKDRIDNLQHEYVVTDKPVDKSAFLETALMSALEGLREGNIDENLIQSLKGIHNMLESANSDDYYWLFHNYLLDLSPYDYDSHFLEEWYSFLLLTLFDTRRYQKAVLSDDSFAEKRDYEDRQHRSNRVCLKRVLKDYNKVIKEMEKGDFSEDIYKEFLLKYRFDCRRLLHYYAVGKKDLNIFDVPFLDMIAVAAETGSQKTDTCMASGNQKQDTDLAVGKQKPDTERSDESRKNAVGSKKNSRLEDIISPEDITPVMVKLDRLVNDSRLDYLVHRFAAMLSHAEKVQAYSSLKNISMSLEEIRNLPAQEQLKLINSTPLNVESFSHIMDDLLAGRGSAEQGHFILNCVDRVRRSSSPALKKTIIQRASCLPDNRLLMDYVTLRFGMKEEFKPLKGTPEKELSTYFNCFYRFVNRGSSFYTDFVIGIPDSDILLLSVRESGGVTKPDSSSYSQAAYPASVIRQVCLSGREEEYEAELQKNQEAVDAFLFEQNNQKFVKEYRQLCDSLTEEKLLFSENAKAGIEWLLYRIEGHNAIAFRVGHRKKYVVKDAQEFLRAFRTNQTVEYGKDLILTHDTDNLDDEDAAVIKLLMAAKTTKGIHGERNNKRYITVNDVLMASVLELLSGRTIQYNDAPCLVRLEPVKVRLQVSRHYKLSIDLRKKDQSFLYLQGKGYILTRQEQGIEQVLDRMDGTAEEAGLVDLVNRNPLINVKPILPDFKKNIYSRFFEMMDVDKTVEKDFVLSQIRCNTYFDFEKSVISARTVVLRDGKEIAADKLTSRIDQQKLEMLSNYLEILGFADGIMQDEGHILSFFKLDFTRLKKLTNVYLSESLKNKELKSVGKPVIRVSYQNNLVRVFLEKSEYSDADMEKIIAALRKKKKYILLSGDRIVDLDSEAARDLGETVKDFGMDPKALHKKKTVSMVTAIKAFSHEKSCSIDKYLRNMIDEIRSFKDAEIASPKLEEDLREYQEEGFRWMSVLSKYHMGGILADDMGLGKTIQVIALIRSDRTHKPSLVVCPKSLVFNWKSEFARFDSKTKVVAIYGPESRRSELIAGIDYKEKAVYVTSYDSLRNDIEKYNGEFNYGILDEAQYIKNIHAQKTRSVKEIRAQHRFALTGTPIENSVVDLWSIFDYIMPGYFDELSQFKESDTAVIARKSAPFILRRVKEDVLDDLPAKYETILTADMNDGQRRLYEAMRMDARKHLEEGGKAFDLLPYLTRLRQVCVDPGMFVEDYHDGSGKLEMLKSLIPQYLEENHRILIFSQFVKALESVERLLKKMDIPTYFLSGATSAQERMEMMDSFNNGSGTDVFLISLKAGGTGLNLTGADTVIHLDPWWNVAAENQASDRTHRIGQTRNVEVIKLIASESIEQRVVELQNIKKEVIRQVISDNDGSVTSASLEDIAFVLE